MKILTGSQIREADQYTIEHEPIESLALMERASEVIAQWICNNIPQEQPLAFFIGKGNNGGDGLAVARMLHNVGYSCSVYVLFDKRQLSVECRYNLERLPHGVRVQGMDRVEVAEDAVAIDALLGTGVRGGLSEPVRGAIALVNGLGCRVISIDLPSGMLSEYGNAGREIVYADVTLTLEFPKLALLLSEAGEAAGEIVILPIELDENYKRQARSPYYYADGRYVSELVLPRSRFAHKGTYGHALLVCGSQGMMGAAVLATGAALRSGCGLVTAHVPAEERFVLHTSCPSALVSGDPMSVFSRLPDDMTKYAAVGIGSGVGRHDLSVRAFDGDRCRCVEYVGGPSRIGRVDASGMRTDSPFGRIAPLDRNVERRSRPNRKGEDVRGALRMLYGRERSAYDGLLSGRTALFQCDGESGNGQRR